MINRSNLNTILLFIIAILMSFGLYMFLTKQSERTIKTEESSSSTTTLDGITDTQKPISIDFSNDIAAAHKEVLMAAFRKPADFNEHYAVASWGCGSGCVSYGIIDKLTGKFYMGPSDDYGNKGNYFGDDDFNASRYSVSQNTFKAIGFESIDTFHFENEKFVKIESQPFPSKVAAVIALPAPYVRAQTVWPPVVEDLPGPYPCTVGSIGMGVRTVTSQKEIGGKSYCVILASEGAPQGIYKTYTYVTMSDAKTRTTTFTLVFSDADGCFGHGTPEENKCQEAQSNFDVESVITNIFSK